jgi:hypothetical protein
MKNFTKKNKKICTAFFRPDGFNKPVPILRFKRFCPVQTVQTVFPAVSKTTGFCGQPEPDWTPVHGSTG